MGPGSWGSVGGEVACSFLGVAIFVSFSDEISFYNPPKSPFKKGDFKTFIFTPLF
jgi:hypothetical protein